MLLPLEQRKVLVGDWADFRKGAINGQKLQIGSGTIKVDNVKGEVLYILGNFGDATTDITEGGVSTGIILTSEPLYWPLRFDKDVGIVDGAGTARILYFTIKEG